MRLCQLGSQADRVTYFLRRRPSNAPAPAREDPMVATAPSTLEVSPVLGDLPLSAPSTLPPSSWVTSVISTPCCSLLKSFLRYMSAKRSAKNSDPGDGRSSCRISGTGCRRIRRCSDCAPILWQGKEAVRLYLIPNGSCLTPNGGGSTESNLRICIRC